MKCFKCGKSLNQAWSFCPFCGERVKNDLFGGLNKMLSKVLKGLTGGRVKHQSFRIKFNNRDGFQPQVKRKSSGKQRVLSLPEELIEPEVSVSNGVNGLVVKAEIGRAHV